MPGDGQHQIHHGLQLGMAEIKDPVAEVEQPERGDRTHDTQDGGDPEHETHVPGFGLFR